MAAGMTTGEQETVEDTLTVALVDDQGALEPIVTAALEGSRFELAYAVSDAETLLENDQQLDTMLAVCELHPLERPAELLLLSAMASDVLTVAILRSGGVPAVRRLLAGGARGIVRADALEDALVPCLEAVVAGQVCVPAEASEHVERPVLSHREKQVLDLVARGLTNAEIAERLYLAESTVKSHLSTSFRKLGVRSRAEAASMVLDPTMRADLRMPPQPSVDDELAALTNG